MVQPPNSAPTSAERDALLSLVDNIDDVAIILLDTRGHVRSWNRGAERLKGYAAAEILGESFSRFYPPEAVILGHPQRELEAATAVGAYEEEGWRVRKDGSRFWARIRIVAICDQAGDLEGFGKVTRDLTAQKQAEDQQANVLALLEATARTDPLTGLPNRRSWDEALEREIARAQRANTPLAVAVIDIDRFKDLNDQHGHRAGDRFLRRCGAAWREVVRAGDIIARYGGDEFALCLPDCPKEGAGFILSRLHAATPDDQTCSIGLAVWNGEEPADALFGRADKAMYSAKASGRNRTVATASKSCA